MAGVIQGLRDTGNWDANERPKNWREGILRLYPNGMAPLTALTNQMKTKPTDDPEFNSYREAAEMPSHRLTMLRRFFQDYKQLEGKAVEVDEIQPAREAFPIIEDALGRYSRQRRKGFK